MQPAPPVLTPERMDAVFSLMAETGVVGLQKVGARFEVADTDEAVERQARALQTVGRYLRQTIALKLRFDREQAEAEAKRRQVAEAERQAAKEVRDAAVAVRRQQVRSRFRDLLWDEYEYEHDDACEMLDGAGFRFDALAEEDPEFLDIPLETLVAQIADHLGMNETYDEVEDEETGSDDSGPDSEAPAPPADTPHERPPTLLFNGRLAPPRDWDLDDS